MEARARAAVAKLQEVTQQVATGGREGAAPSSPSGDTEVISRTLLLAQRTADLTIADARTEAESITAHAREEASRVLDSARTMAAKTVDESRADARRAVEDERVRAENEVQSLLARRDFLLGDVDHLEQYLQAQRERLRDAAVQLQELVDRVPGGLGDMRRPLLSASAAQVDESPQHPGLHPVAGGGAATEADPGSAAPTQAPAQPEPPEGDQSAADANPSQPDDHSPLFTSLPDRSAGLAALALSGSAEAQDSVWRLLDEEVATTQAAQASFALGDVTAEVPVQPQPQQQEADPFRIGGDELR